MAKFYQTQSFLKLHAEWQRKLEASGFEDIETTSGENLKQYAPNSYRQAHRLIREAKLEYFRLITHKAHDDEFIGPLSLTIMTMRGDGVPIIEIADEIGLHRQTVRYIIRRHEHRWGIRFWTARQRNLKHG